MRRILAALGLTGWACAHAASPVQMAASLVDLSLEQLSSIVVSTVSGREEPLSRAPASVYVISAEDIRRSGALNLSEALRLAPNLQVARPDANQYAITARGFNGILANRLLILIDGRTVYSPLFSGTFWEAQDVLLEDVERIEVISGPGATLWGANAVNGVINVITRPAADTQGVMATAGAGEAQRDGAFRYGGAVAGGHYRGYAKATRRDTTTLPGGTPTADHADHAQAGFRADWGRRGHGFTLQGDLYGGQLGPIEREIAGLNLLGRWTRDLGGGASLRTQAYFDRTSRHHTGIVKEHLDTYDFELQHALAPRGRHRLLWGFGLRHYRDRVQNYPGSGVAFIPPNRNLERNHVFVQDEIALLESLDLTLGAKAETNSYTGTEWLPSVRLAWRPAPQHLVWSALSRAVRAPSRIDRDLFQGPLAGGPEFQSEVSNVFELGYRAQPASRLSVSVTGFYHEHEELRSIALTPGGLVFANDAEGRTSGMEAWGSWRAAQWARFSAGFVRLHQSLRVVPGAVDLGPAADARDPESWWKAQAAFDLGAASELDFLVRHYEALPGNTVSDYTAVDVRFAWRASRRVELALLLQNLLDPRHVEWAPGAELERSAHLRLRVDL
ncbi:MAG TPA: TonB-dependent receptor [Burkholderiales bacterium]